MNLSLEEIENFFGTSFDAMVPGPGLALNHFDGYAHWSVLYTGKGDLYINADNRIGGSSFPVVELTAYCSRISASYADGVGPTLILYPNDTAEPSRLAVLTKTKSGRISLSICVGTAPEFERAKPNVLPNGPPLG